VVIQHIAAEYVCSHLSDEDSLWR